MRDEIKSSIERMSKDDCKDVQITCKLKDSKKATIKKMAFADEAIAEYVLQY